jgi:serine/threonine protein kinase
MDAATPNDNVALSGVELVRLFARDLSDAGTMAVTAPRPASRYQLGERLERGGRAEVFRGTLTGAQGFVRDVAIKRPRAERAGALVDEALLVAQLIHPNIVQALDLDRDADGRHFLVMELVEGRSLHALRESGPLPPAIINFIVTEALRGLGYAHAAGVVHGEVSLHSVRLSWQAAVKVADFGATGEQNPRRDLVAVGVMLTELTCGRSDIPSDLEAVATKLRDDRYASADEAIADLVNCRDVPRNGRGDLVRLLAERFHGARVKRSRARASYIVASFAAIAAALLAACA